MPKRIKLPSRVDHIELDMAEIGLPEIKLVGIHDVRSANAGLSEHIHKGHMEICYLTKGERVYRVNNKDYKFRGNELFVTMPDEVHGSGKHPHGKGLLYWTQIRIPKKPEPFLGLSAGDGWRLIQSLKKIKHRHFVGERILQTIFEDIIGILNNRRQHPLAKLEISSRMIQWLAIVVNCSDKETQRQVTPDIRKAQDFVRESITELIGVDDMAEKAGLSTSRFKIKFKEQVGMPPSEYIVRQKIAKAQEMLATGMKVTDVAFDLGFSSSQYFATVYKRITSVCPHKQ